MPKKHTAEAIEALFADLSPNAQVDILSNLYFQLDAAHKDAFLRETDNA